MITLKLLGTVPCCISIAVAVQCLLGIGLLNQFGLASLTVTIIPGKCNNYCRSILLL